MSKLPQRDFVVLVTLALPDDRTIGFKAIDGKLVQDFQRRRLCTTRRINVFNSK